MIPRPKAKSLSPSNEIGIFIGLSGRTPNQNSLEAKRLERGHSVHVNLLAIVLSLFHEASVSLKSQLGCHFAMWKIQEKQALHWPNVPRETT